MRGLAPTSEHGLARWLETDFVCDRQGRRWLPQWREEAERLASRRPRVRVHDGQLKQWYQTLDGLGRRRNLKTIAWPVALEAVEQKQEVLYIDWAELQDFIPLALQGGDILQLGQFKGVLYFKVI